MKLDDATARDMGAKCALWEFTEGGWTVIAYFSDPSDGYRFWDLLKGQTDRKLTLQNIR